MSPIPMRNRLGRLLACAALVLAFSPPPATADDDDDAGLRITRAEWRARTKTLRVEGTRAPRRSEVLVSNPAGGDPLASIRSDKKGRFAVNVRNVVPVPCTIRAASGGISADARVRNAPADCDAGAGTPPPVPGAGGDYTVVSANDLGMHCADLDYQIFSILPPFNVVHAQVVKRALPGTTPRLVSGDEVDVVYSAASNPTDPAGAGSINSTSVNRPGVFKSNFWERTALADGSVRTLGGLTYAPLYPATACATPPCPSLLAALFEPLDPDVGIPVPDPAHLPGLVAGRQSMPGVAAPYSANRPQRFDRYDATLPFFAGFPFGTTVANARWFAADGIPILPVDDRGVPNAYPLMRVSAVDKRTGTTLASVDVVLPVASEADCQTCHAAVDDFGNGAASSFAGTRTYADGITAWKVARASEAPGPEPLNNAAKINILRLHDAKHGAAYVSSADGSATPCRSGTEPSCLDQRRRIQCSQCHYSPALDLAQAGPVNEPQQGVNGRQQTRHVSMSRAMHGHHGEFTELFPAMPPPGQRTPQQAVQILEQTCYTCHPGKRTQCLRGAMSAPTTVCQDCHGNMKQVGNDFTRDLPGGGGANLALRVPWASEPKCQSCHVGDAVSVRSMDRSDFIVAADGIRLLQAYRKSDAGQDSLPMIQMPGSRFAENEVLYRLSTGHGGVKCEGCHGSTHAIWPHQNPASNDNVTATQLQGHSGKIIECDVCHKPGSLGLTLDGPHGMHPVDRNWNLRHEDIAERNRNSCRACHGQRGEGTVLSRTAANRTLFSDEDGRRTISLPKGTPVRCNHCHENEL